MENSFQTSFIPKKPIIANSAVSSSPSSKTTSISITVSVFILIVMLLASGGLYFYKDYLTKNKLALSESLKTVKESFNNDTISELETYDKTSSAAKQVLANHIVLSPLFELINELTLSSIQYNKFENKTINNVFSVRMSGIARDYKSIALQADVFNTAKGRMFKDVVFSNLTKDPNNFVTFDVEFDVDPALLSYSNNLKNISEVQEKEVVNPATLPSGTADMTNTDINTNTNVNTDTNTNIVNNNQPASTNVVNNNQPLKTPNNTKQ